MAKIPPAKNSTIEAIDVYHESKKSGTRYHLGPSLIGHHCDRWVWLSFRWAIKEKFPGRILRLFRRGQMEEDTVVEDLRNIGCDITTTDADGKQLRVQLGGHLSGSVDGVIWSGLPEAPNKKHVLEIKTHNTKSFKDLQKQGAEKSKPMHYAQMQLYMHGLGIDRALYYAVNKESDDIYTERVRYAPKVAKELVARAEYISTTDRLPEPCLGASPTWYLCKFCPGYDFCHQDAEIEQKNCRTCQYARPQDDGQWICEHWGAEIPRDAQKEGCDHYVMHPDLDYGGGP